MSFDMNKSLGFILNRTALASKSAFNQKIKDYEISPEQWSVIYRVVETPGISQKVVSDSTYKDQGNLTRMIDKLVKNGFLTKKQNSENRREIQLFPTTKSVDLSKTIAKHSTEHNQNMLNNFSKEEKEQLFSLLNKVYENLNKKD